MTRSLALLALLVMAPAAVAAPLKPIPRDARAWAAAEAARPEQMKLLEQVVDIDSGAGDVAGGRKEAALFAERLRTIGADVQMVQAEAPGLPENLVATLKGDGKGRILMIAHMDTVFEAGEAARRPFRTDADKAYGPGVGDEKGGVVEAIYAQKILHDLGFRNFGRIVFLIETSEERGSPGTQGLIARLARDADVELNLEPGDTPDVLTVWRKSAVNPATEALADRAEAIYAGLGLRIGRGGNGGASESALASAAGVPALDGLGPAGGGFHSPNEYILLSTATPRLYLLTKLIEDLGRNPPARPG